MLQFALLAVVLYVTIRVTIAVVMNNGLKGIFNRTRYRRTTNK